MIYCLSVGCAVLAITTGKKKDTVVCLAGCAVVLVFGYGGKLAFFVVAGNFDYDRKKKIQLSVWRVRDDYYDRKKKRYSRLSLVTIVIFVLVQHELNLIQIH